MKILVTGAAGMLGSAVEKRFAERHTVIGVDLPEGDLTVPADVEMLAALHTPDWIIHAAAFTDVDGAEERREDAWQINAFATAHLVATAQRLRAGLTYISTDYVFPGTDPNYLESAIREPINYYGRSKAGGEEAVELATVPWQIVRTSWLFGPGPRNFVLTIRRLLRVRESISVVDDQHGCPTYAPDLADLLLCLVERSGNGYFHGTNSGSCTWFEFAREIARCSGADPERISPCSTVDFPTPARRPLRSVLVSERAEALGCPPRPSWQDALARYIRWLDDQAAQEQIPGIS